jgi:hypothetical protein
VFLLLAIVCSTKTLFAQGFDRIERERALAMLATIKDQLKKNYYDPNIRGMDLDARFKTAEERSNKPNRWDKPSASLRVYQASFTPRSKMLPKAATSVIELSASLEASVRHFIGPWF